jgi:phage terminase large subunit-like protein
MVVPTATNVRDVMVNGKSGILTVSWPDFMAAD